MVFSSFHWNYSATQRNKIWNENIALVHQTVLFWNLHWMPKPCCTVLFFLLQLIDLPVIVFPVILTGILWKANNRAHSFETFDLMPIENRILTLKMIILEFNNLFFNEFNYIGFFVQRASTETEFQTHNIKQTNNCHIKTGISHRHIRYSLFILSLSLVQYCNFGQMNED